MKHALILAAGRGSRLDGDIGKPKCLTAIGGRSLLEYQIENLTQLGVEHIAVVVGYRRDQVRQVLRDTVHYIDNVRYATTDSLYSLWLARHWIAGEFLLLNGDVLAHPQVYARLAAAQDDALTFDSSSGMNPEHMKVYSVGGVLRRISKRLPPEMTSGENVGLLRFGAAGAGGLFEAAGQALSEEGTNGWAPAAVDRVADSVAIECVDIAGMDWVEIDFPEDVREARARVWP